MSTTDLEELLRNKKRAEGPTINWEGRKTVWLRKIEELFRDIKDWLASLCQDGLLTIEEDTDNLNERHIGPYLVPTLRITNRAGEEVRLSPVATQIIAGYGRIDMLGPNWRKLTIVLSSSDRPAAFHARVFVGDGSDMKKVTSTDHDTPKLLSIVEIMDKHCRWYFVDPSDGSHRRLVTQKSFEDALIGMFAP
ncbi:MAG: hypothetical protein HQL07_06050 [Nitrospirae bacterium]|nr:hypothetical protein [Magnetococcales bacterium]HAT49485.1 hypothetical protein [Alphaproteobacteria bacterium]